MSKKFGGKYVLGRSVGYFPRLARFFRSVKVCVFVSQFGYWEGKQRAKGSRFIYKSQRELEFETGLTRYEQETVRKYLLNKKYMEEKLAGIPATMNYRFNWEKMALDFEDWIHNIDIKDQYLIETPDVIVEE